MKKKYLLMICLLAGCSASEEVDKELYRYQCGEYAVDADYKNNGAVLYDGANQVDMFRMPSASGVKFEAGIMTGSEKDTQAIFWSRGEQATLMLTPGETFPCIVRGASVKNQ